MQDAQYELHAEIEEHHWWFTGRRRIVRRIVQHVIEPGRGHSVIDFGCGTGANVAALATEYSCLGVDASPQAIELARARFPDVEFSCAAEGSTELAGGSGASCVLLMDVLEHVEDDFLLLSSLLEQMPEGSHMLLTVPADPRLWSEHDESFGHYRRYDLERLEAVWGGLPVTPRLVSYYNTRLYPVIRAVRGITSRRGRAGGASGTDFSLPPEPLNRSLAGLFAGEARALLRSLDREGAPAYRRGASLIALLRREAGAVEQRTRPPGLAPDASYSRRGGSLTR